MHGYGMARPGQCGAAIVCAMDTCCPSGGTPRYVTWLISRRWPSGSRKKQRISPPQSTGGVKKTAPRAMSVS